MQPTIHIAAGLMLAASASAQIEGLVPLPDLGQGTYKSFQGGLYPDGQNVPPLWYWLAAVEASHQVQPRTAAGLVDPASGLIGLVALGMSNAAIEFSVFERRADADTSRNAQVVIINGAIGGKYASDLAAADPEYWTLLDQRVAAAGLTPAQVQVAWIKTANAEPPDDFPGHALELADQLGAIVDLLAERFPNLRLCYVSSRIYAGYATSPLNPEPQAYESGFAVKWLIEAEMERSMARWRYVEPALELAAPGLDTTEPALHFAPDNGTDWNHPAPPTTPRARPVVLWGPYMWANGPEPNGDGLVWLPEDFGADGTHPSETGALKVAQLLEDFFWSEPTAAPWWPKSPFSRLVAIDASDDAHVDATAPDENFGLLAELRTAGGLLPTRGYLRFDLSHTTRPILHAKLSLYAADQKCSPMLLWRVGNTAWDESTITWATQPGFDGPVVASVPEATKNTTLSAGATPATATDADRVVAFGLMHQGSDQTALLHSRQSSNPPRLIITLADEFCFADFNGDGTVDVTDWLAFLGAHAAGDPSADCDGNGTVDVLDVVCFAAAFEDGCL